MNMNLKMNFKIPFDMNLRRALIIILILVCITVNVVGITLYSRQQNVENSELWVAHTHEVIAQASTFYSNIEKLVGLQRGYLISGRREFMADYLQDSKSLDRDIEQLMFMTHDNASQVARLKEIREKLDVLRSMLEMKVNGVRMGKKPRPMTIDDDIYQVKHVADMLRQEVGDFIGVEQGLLQERSKETIKQERYYFYALLISSIISVLVLLGANALILYLSIQQRRAEHELDAAEQDLDKAQERLKLVLQGTNDGVFDWNITTNDIYFSHRYREMLGYNIDDLPNTIDGFDAVLHPDDREKFWRCFNNFMTGETPEYRDEFRLHHKDGSWRWYLARAKAVEDDLTHRRYRIVGAHTDINEMKAAEERLKASNRELEDFTYIASHDLRSPLVNLKGFAGEIESGLGLLKEYIPAALKKVKTEKEAEILEAIESDLPQAIGFIKNSVTKMEKLTRAILELSRVGRRQLRFEIIDCNLIVRSILSTFQHQITTQKVDIVIGDLPAVIGDMIAIEQVFANLIDNALKYMDDSRPGKIEITGVRGASETIFNIADNGRGIRPEDSKKIFELFKRAGRHSNIPGEGMGLSYVQTILRRHDGTVWVESELDHGSTFHFAIPNFLNPESINKEESNG
jgi:PAS domain S-box-containing protein